MRNTPVSIVVQGRFHAFALAKALLDLEVPVEVITNYPGFVASRFGLPNGVVKSFRVDGVMHRLAYRWNLVGRVPGLEEFLHTRFSRLAAKHVSLTEPSVVHVFSGVAREIYTEIAKRRLPALKMLSRGSCHIRDQYLELAREERRTGVKVEKPSRWMVRREMEEYRLADRIVTLSSFAKNTFLRRGYSAERIQLLPLGASSKTFRPSRDVTLERIRRVRAGGPLKVLCTGTVCLRKGVYDFLEIAKALSGQMQFIWVGNVAPDAAELVAAHQTVVDFRPRVPEHELPRFYNEADCYLLPTIEDGFAVVLAQAHAACVPILASVNCAAPDLVEQGVTGWSLPIRKPVLYIEKLRLWNSDREMLVQMVENLWAHENTRDWSDVAEDFIALVKTAISAVPAFDFHI